MDPGSQMAVKTLLRVLDVLQEDKLTSLGTAILLILEEELIELENAVSIELQLRGASRLPREGPERRSQIKRTQGG